MSAASARSSIFCEDCLVLSHESFSGDQHILRLQAPKAARRAEPGTFAHIVCDESVKLRRPLSIMRAEPHAGWLEFLYKPVGHGLARLAEKKPGDVVNVLAPIGRGFDPTPERPRIIAIGGGVGIPPMLFLADRLRHDGRFRPLVLMGSEAPFPFELCESRLEVAGAAPGATHGVDMLERWGVPSRLASLAQPRGCHRGYVTELARDILSGLKAEQLAEVQVFACGPEAMLAATAGLVAEYGVECDIALEEYMACGVGGCAGCTVLVKTPGGPAMKRVCVDGPVFCSREIYAA